MSDYEHPQYINIEKGTSDKGVPYTELSIDYFFEYPITVTIRAYTKNIFICYEDNRNNPSSGADLLDCWLAPKVLLKKTPIRGFDLKHELESLAKHLGLDEDYGYIEEVLEYVKERKEK